MLLQPLIHPPVRSFDAIPTYKGTEQGMFREMDDDAIMSQQRRVLLLVQGDLATLIPYNLTTPQPTA